MRYCLVTVIMLGLISQASAGLLPVSVTVTPESGNYRWTYAIVLPTDMQLQSGNYFTIYDFHGLIPGSDSAPAGWTFSKTNVGPTPDRLNPSDDPATVNLTWTYNGPTLASGQVGLGNFWAYSTFGMLHQDYFTAETYRTSDGLFDRNLTTTSTPFPQAGPTVPEPGTLLMAGLGLPLVGLIGWRKSRKIA